MVTEEPEEDEVEVEVAVEEDLLGLEDLEGAEAQILVRVRYERERLF